MPSSDDATPVIQCRGLSKSFGSDPVVDSVDLDVHAGEVLALVGPSGSGKTTLLRIIAGFETPDRGTITLGGKPAAGPGVWTPAEERRLGMVFQDYALFPHMTVAENVAFGLTGLDRSNKARRVTEALGLVRLSGMSDRYPHQLSGGEQQRVAVARSLAPQPIALLLDEPFSNLDLQLRERLRQDVKEIFSSSGVTVVYVTHDQEEALFMGDTVAVIDGGSIQQSGAPEEVYHRPRSPFVASFLGMADYLSAVSAGEGLDTELGKMAVEEAVGDGCRVMVRPDDVMLRSPGSRGTISNRIFQGTHYLYEVTLPSGETVHSFQNHTVRYEIGDSVEPYLESGQTLVCFSDGGDAVPVTVS